MSHAGKQDEPFTDYLLGNLTESDQTAVEQEFFGDPEKFEEVLAAENQLIDNYVRGRLTDGERQLFERHYLRSPVHTERVAVAELLLDAADRSAAEQLSSRPAEVAPFARGDSRKSAVGWRQWWVGLAAAALLLSVGGFVWLARERQRLKEDFARASARIAEQQQHEQENAGQLSAAQKQNGELGAEVERLRAELAGRPPAGGNPPPAERNSVLSFLLSPVLVRGEGNEPQRITIPQGNHSIRLRMKVGDDAPLKYQVEISSVEGRRIWSQKSIKHTAGGVFASVPANSLPANDYILTLSSVNERGEREEVNRYYFRVMRR